MATNIHQLIAAISSQTYCDASVRRQVERLLAERIAEGDCLAYLKAAQIARPREANLVETESVTERNLNKLPGLLCPVEKHVLVFDSMDERLERIYFELLDSVTGTEDWTVRKLVDNTLPTPGSELSQDLINPQMRMQKEAMNMFRLVHKTVPEILGRFDPLKAMRQQLGWFTEAKLADPVRRTAAITSLEQVWRKERQSGERMGIAVHGKEHRHGHGEAIEPSALEGESFRRWLNTAEGLLRQRYQIERSWMRSQVNLLKLCARWLKPYLSAGGQFHPSHGAKTPWAAAFNTVLIEVVLLAEGPGVPGEDLERGILSRLFRSLNPRSYHPVVLIELTFRAMPERFSSGGYGYKGRVEIAFTSYALNREEIEALLAELDRDEVGELMGAVESQTAEDFAKLLHDLNDLLEDKPEAAVEVKDTSGNPFSALFSGIIAWFRRSHKNDRSATEYLKTCIPPDSSLEQEFRSRAIIQGRMHCAHLFEQLKERFCVASRP